MLKKFIYVANTLVLEFFSCWAEKNKAYSDSIAIAIYPLSRRAIKLRRFDYNIRRTLFFLQGVWEAAFFIGVRLLPLIFVRTELRLGIFLSYVRRQRECTRMGHRAGLTTKITGGNGAQRNCRPVERLVMRCSQVSSLLE